MINSHKISFLTNKDWQMICKKGLLVNPLNNKYNTQLYHQLISYLLFRATSYYLLSKLSINGVIIDF